MKIHKMIHRLTEPTLRRDPYSHYKRLKNRTIKRGMVWKRRYFACETSCEPVLTSSTVHSRWRHRKPWNRRTVAWEVNVTIMHQSLMMSKPRLCPKRSSKKQTRNCTLRKNQWYKKARCSPTSLSWQYRLSSTLLINSRRWQAAQNKYHHTNTVHISHCTPCYIRTFHSKQQFLHLQSIQYRCVPSQTEVLHIRSKHNNLSYRISYMFRLISWGRLQQQKGNTHGFMNLRSRTLQVHCYITIQNTHMQPYE